MAANYGVVVKATRRGLNAVTSKLSDKVLFQQAHQSLEDSLKELRALVIRDTPVATGVTAQNIFYDINGSTLDNLEGVVASPDVWFPVLEYGRRAGAKMPPQLPIEEWLNAKGLEASAQFVVRRAIARRGLPALHIMHNAMEEGRRHFAIIWFRRFLASWGRTSPTEDP